MKLLTATIILGLGLAACSKSDSGGNGGGGSGGNVSNNTDLSSCKGAPPNGATAVGSWVAKFKNGDEDFKLRLTFSPNSMKNEITCDDRGKHAQASVEVPASLQPGQILVPELAQRSGWSADGTYQCTAEISQNVYQYVLVGNCIKVTFGQYSTTLVRE